jgi:hypothetical protein
MVGPEIHEADARYLDRVAEDCAELLGPGVEVFGVELGVDDGVRLSLRYRLGSVDGTSEGRGETPIAAHADLRRRLVEDRIGLAIRALYRAVD